jgi:hypothetical protein
MEGSEFRGIEPDTSTFALHWAEGVAIPGVSFARSSHVRILGGAFAEECGCVRDLISLEPEPCYRVEIDAAHVELDLPESSLGRV